MIGLEPWVENARFLFMYDPLFRGCWEVGNRYNDILYLLIENRIQDEDSSLEKTADHFNSIIADCFLSTVNNSSYI